MRRTSLLWSPSSQNIYSHSTLLYSVAGLGLRHLEPAHSKCLRDGHGALRTLAILFGVPLPAAIPSSRPRGTTTIGHSGQAARGRPSACWLQALAGTEAHRPRPSRRAASSSCFCCIASRWRSASAASISAAKTSAHAVRRRRTYVLARPHLEQGKIRRFLDAGADALLLRCLCLGLLVRLPFCRLAACLICSMRASAMRS